MISPALIIYYVTYGINMFFALLLLCLSVFAFVEALRAAPQAYTMMNRRTKGFWTGVTGACLLYSVLAVLPIGINSLLIQLVVAVAVGVFLADVRPIVSARKRS